MYVLTSAISSKVSIQMATNRAVTSTGDGFVTLNRLFVNPNEPPQRKPKPTAESCWIVQAQKPALQARRYDVDRPWLNPAFLPTSICHCLNQLRSDSGCTPICSPISPVVRSRDSRQSCTRRQDKAREVLSTIEGIGRNSVDEMRRMLGVLRNDDVVSECVP